MSSRLSGTTTVTLGIQLFQPFVVPSTAALKPPGLSFRSRSQCSCAFFPPVGTLLNNGALHRDVFAPIQRGHPSQGHLRDSGPEGPAADVASESAGSPPREGENRGASPAGRGGVPGQAGRARQAGPAGRGGGPGAEVGRPSRPVPRSGAGSPPGADGTGQQRLAAVCWPGPPQIASVVEVLRSGQVYYSAEV